MSYLLLGLQLYYLVKSVQGRREKGQAGVGLFWAMLSLYKSKSDT